MHSDETFCSGRYERAGHEGWNDPFIYAYDQLERRALVEAELEGLAALGNSVLDFGCGSGDFSHLLLDRGFAVTAHEPFVHPPVSHPEFAFAASQGELDPCGAGFDLILTVLDHILEEGVLARTLTRLQSLAREGGG